MLTHILHFKFTYPTKYTSEQQTPCTCPLLPGASLHLHVCLLACHLSALTPTQRPPS